ncbi:ABC transporter ATP-binding protein [Anaerosacchariphilus sp. NSJ-68]|uniref:ABC transporter ATP-binding protein n=2 Tax=Lachnospiraceae TaxID=186803 RepID=A0A923LBK0_9FIRM|nr:MULTISPECIES: ABC transporter ATP-binding protein [Lachnospiraceae]MBC5659341.1 ABC transporter ATP-binding protein [Anaerosacchariphilus hominis]MBC5697007.1 ABC transporter ATP-binding protein [Roseburia difficilis]
MLIRLFSYMNQYKKYAALAVICIMTEGIFELLVPLIMADLIDVGVANGDRSYIYMKGLQMVACALIALVLGVGSARFAALTGQGLGAELRKAEYEKLQGYSFANIDHFRSSSLVTRLTSDVTNIQNAVSMGMRPFCRGPMMLVVATGVAFSINHTLAIVFFVALPVLATALFVITMKVRPLYSRMQTAIDTVNRIVQENLTAVRVVKACVRGGYEVEKFEEGNQKLRQESETAFRLAALNMPAMQFVMYGTILSILLFGGYLIQKGSMKVGELTGFLSYVLQILNSLMMISNVFLMLTRSMASGARILEVIDEKVDLTDEKARDIEVKHGSVEFEHVWFKYKKEAKEYVLSDISFHIEAGQTVGVIGQTGAAKSTLVQLIPRLYDATEGVVKVDGVPVQEYPMAHLRDAIAMVLQKNTLFSGSLLDNLRWGKENASREEIEEACRIACVDEVLERLPQGYETEMGQGGVNVSGGQKQRICIARALLKKPKILILDDSTSAVDTATEAKIRERMGKALPDMTKIIIGQRISSVRHADQIIILDDGRVSDIGTHEELLTRSEIYQQIYESQKEGVEL